MDFRVDDLVKITGECDACDDRKLKLPCRYIGRVGRINLAWPNENCYIVEFNNFVVGDRTKDAWFRSFGETALRPWNGLETVFEIVP